MRKFAFLSTLLLTLPVAAGLTEGMGYFDRQLYPQAFNEFKPLADRGNEQAQYYTAYLYLNGYGVTADENLGLQYLNKSADQGYEKAQALLGYFYSEGRHVSQNKTKALELYNLAAQNGDDDALLNLGVMYYTGDGVPRDTEKAIEYLTQVDLVNKPIVGRYLGDIYQFSEKPEERAKSKNLYVLSAVNGDIGSFHALGYFYQIGKDGNKNMDEAIKYYKYAASKGYAPSQYAIGMIYANGEGISKDQNTAYAWISLAANQGLEAAVKAQDQLSKSMTLSELDRARREVVQIQQTIFNNLESPIQASELTGSSTTSDETGTTQKKRRPRSRRRSR